MPQSARSTQSPPDPCPLRPEELHPHSVDLTRTWGPTTLMRRLLKSADFAEASQGTCDHLLVCNPEADFWHQQQRDGRCFEQQYPSAAVNLLPAHEGFYWEWTDAVHPAICSFQVYLNPLLVRRVAEDACGLNPDRVQLRHGFDIRDEPLNHCLFLLHRELETRQAGSSLFVETLSQALALHLVRHYATHNAREVSQPGRLDARQLRTIDDYLDAHLAENITLPDLAELAGQSLFHFARCFKQTTGHTPHQHLMQRRIQRARRMLDDPRLAERNVAWIATRCGFADQSHLSRRFKSAFGVTPAVYRQQSLDRSTPED
ncbi:MAG: AraC family transcriptional regulator [Planctomycetota bacterium]